MKGTGIIDLSAQAKSIMPQAAHREFSEFMSEIELVYTELFGERKNRGKTCTTKNVHNFGKRVKSPNRIGAARGGL